MSEYLDEVKARVGAASELAAVEAVLALHTPEDSCGNTAHTSPGTVCPECAVSCSECGNAYPCPTIRALDGEGGS